MQFKILNNKKTPVDLVEFCKDFTDKFQNFEIVVGTDSQITEGHINYVTVVALRMLPNKGARVVYTVKKVKLSYEISMFERLSQEALISIELVEHLRENGVNVNKVELDCQKTENKKSAYINGRKAGKPQNMSSTVYNAYAGWIESIGCEVLGKPDSLMATVAADQLTR